MKALKFLAAAITLTLSFGVGAIPISYDETFDGDLNPGTGFASDLGAFGVGVNTVKGTYSCSDPGSDPECYGDYWSADTTGLDLVEIDLQIWDLVMGFATDAGASFGTQFENGTFEGQAVFDASTCGGAGCTFSTSPGTGEMPFISTNTFDNFFAGFASSYPGGLSFSYMWTVTTEIADTTGVPAPFSVGLFGAGLALLGLMRGRRRD